MAIPGFSILNAFASRRHLAWIELSTRGIRHRIPAPRPLFNDPLVIAMDSGLQGVLGVEDPISIIWMQYLRSPDREVIHIRRAPQRRWYQSFARCCLKGFPNLTCELTVGQLLSLGQLIREAGTARISETIWFREGREIKDACLTRARRLDWNVRLTQRT